MAATIRKQRPHFKKTGASRMGGQPKKENTVAWCNYFRHSGALSAKMMKNHSCLGKQCPYLVKNASHPYWALRESKKAAKKLAKEMRAA